MVEDLHVVLRVSAAVSPHAIPPYLVVLRDLNAGRHFTYAALALYIATVYRDEKPLARLRLEQETQLEQIWSRSFSFYRRALLVLQLEANAKRARHSQPCNETHAIKRRKSNEPPQFGDSD
ncbi:hypothetical protein CYMTET_34636 [Cymbomonas tetramitiformis]|uniref:Uncharacterized protein n=1 Tax=Cymbomonas tetramitiformis TaxID=36881 RepID=A0AAE0KPS2_9CHLO|nr:hypothetical protein CYMTET_34636 [Cymbomonas tetramitiformis]